MGSGDLRQVLECVRSGGVFGGVTQRTIPKRRGGAALQGAGARFWRAPVSRRFRHHVNRHLANAQARLDFRPRSGQEAGKVFSSKPSVYAKWRAERLSDESFREGPDGRPAESLVRAIWQHQRIRRHALQTLDGQLLRVWHPGFPNVEPGPDFRAAVIQIGEAAPRTGDVEVDLQASGWRGHRHDQNPAFANVALHVVWHAERAASTLPTLVLRELLDAPVDELALCLGREPAGAWPELLRGQCCAPLKEFPREALTGLLHDAARVRWESKAAQFRARAREAGWEQAFWEGMFRALGYKHNAWPMQNLAEARAGWELTVAGPLQWQARLLGLSNLLPAEAPRERTAAARFVRQAWDCWWRERDALATQVLPRAAWRLAGLRPANHPQRRLALAAHWLAQGDLVERLERWFTSRVRESSLASSLLSWLQVPRDEFWSWHWTLRTGRLSRPQPLLGLTRVTDLAMNVILPWFWVRALEGRNEQLQHEAEYRYFHWPAGEDNSRLRFGRERLLGGASKRALVDAASQQGMLQVLRDFCAHSNALCEQCRFPELVRQQLWAASKVVEID